MSGNVTASAIGGAQSDECGIIQMSKLQYSVIMKKIWYDNRHRAD